MANRIHAELVQLLRDHIQTYEQLEVLLLLGRDPRRDWGTDAVAAGLHLPGIVGSDSLEHLAKAGLLTCTPEASGDRFRCHPSTARVLNSLTRTYDNYRVGVPKMVNQNAVTRLRTSAERTFTALWRRRKRIAEG